MSWRISSMGFLPPWVNFLLAATGGGIGGGGGTLA